MLEKLMRQWKADPIYSDDTVVRYFDFKMGLVMANGDLTDIADEVIEAQIEFHKSTKMSFEWKLFSCDRPTDLKDRLAAKGFEIGAKEVVVAMDMTKRMPPFKPGIRVKRVRTEQELNDFRSVAESVFGKDFDYTTGILAKCIADGSDLQIGFVAYDGFTPVSVGRLDHVMGTACAGFYTGGTLATHRGRGFYQAIVAERARHAKERGASIIYVDALPTSRPILLRLGFEEIVETWPCKFAVDESGFSADNQGDLEDEGNFRSVVRSQFDREAL